MFHNKKHGILCQSVIGPQIVPYSWKVPDAILFLSTFIYKDIRHQEMMGRREGRDWVMLCDSSLMYIAAQCDMCTDEIR